MSPSRGGNTRVAAGGGLNLGPCDPPKDIQLGDDLIALANPVRNLRAEGFHIEHDSGRGALTRPSGVGCKSIWFEFPGGGGVSSKERTPRRSSGHSHHRTVGP